MNILWGMMVCWVLYCGFTMPGRCVTGGQSFEYWLCEHVCEQIKSWCFHPLCLHEGSLTDKRWKPQYWMGVEVSLTWESRHAQLFSSSHYLHHFSGSVSGQVTSSKRYHSSKLVCSVIFHKQSFNCQRNQFTSIKCHCNLVGNVHPELWGWQLFMTSSSSYNC